MITGGGVNKVRLCDETYFNVVKSRYCKRCMYVCIILLYTVQARNVYIMMTKSTLNFDRNVWNLSSVIF